MFGLGETDERKVTASTLSEQNHNGSSKSSGIPVNPSCAVFIVGQFVTNSVGT